MLKGLKFVAASAVVCAASAAHGLSVTYGPASHGPATTNWSTSLVLPQWDPALFPGYTLTGVSFALNGHVSGDAKFESLDGSPATINMSLQSTITLTDPLSNVLATIIPVANTSDSATAFDGTIDFGGTSGKSYLGLSGSDSDTGASAPLPLYIGNSTISLPVSATGTSFGSGAGNLTTIFSTSADADASVTYYYEPVPEPASLGLLAAAGLLGLRRRRA